MIKVPILKNHDILIASIQEELDDESIILFENDILNKVKLYGINYILLDLSTIEILDSFFTKKIGDISKASRLLGSRLIVVGMNPEVALTFTDMGLSLEHCSFALNLEKAFELVEKCR